MARTSSPGCCVITTLLCLCFAGLSEGANEKHEWGYGKRNGPQEWQGVCSSGLFQSPIDLSVFKAHPRTFEPLVFFQYDAQANITVKNNGHTVKLTMQQPCAAQMAGGGLPGPYTLAQVHFHWGSEHTVDDIRYPLEAHFVHYDKSRFNSLKEAVGQDGGLAVLGVLFRESTAELNPALSRVLNGVSGVTEEGSEVKLPAGGLKLQQLLPRDRENFYRYRGSLTTPTCDEGVVWTVFSSYVPVSKDQVAQFKELKSRSETLDVNYRPIQPLHERNLYIRVPTSSATSLFATISWVLLSTCALFLSH